MICLLKEELNELNFGDSYATEYKSDLRLNVKITIKGSIWSEKNNKPYSLTLFYDKNAYEKYVE